MNNDNVNNQNEMAQDLLDFLAAEKEARRITPTDDSERENISAAARRARRTQERSEKAAGEAAAQPEAEEPLSEFERDLTEALAGGTEAETEAAPTPAADLEAFLTAEAERETEPAPAPVPEAEEVAQTVSEAEARKLGATVFARATKEYDADVTFEDAAPALPDEAEEPAVDEKQERKARKKAEKEAARQKKAEARAAAAEQKRAAEAAAAQEAEELLYAPDLEEDEDEPKRRKKGGWIVFGIVALLLCAAVIGSFLVSRMDKIYPGVQVEGLLLEGMTKAEAAETLQEAGWDGANGTIMQVTLPGDYIFKVPASTMSWKQSAADAAENIWDYGRDGNIFANLLHYISSYFRNTDLTDRIAPDGLQADALRELVNKSVDEANELVTDTIKIDTEAKVLTLIKGSELLAADPDSVYEAVSSALADHVSNLECRTKFTDDMNVDDIDMQALHDELCGKPVNARYDAKKKEIVEAVPGIEFDVKEAKRLWTSVETGETVKIPVTLIEADFKAADVKELYADLLATKTTSLVGSSAERISNITRVASELNGTTIMPGKTFSFNDTIGQRNKSTGYLEAEIYPGHAADLGDENSHYFGGASQVSSTLYYDAILANLKITSRSAHPYSANFIESGFDAYLFWPKPDFSFQNTRTFPIRIDSRVEGTSLIVEIYGTDVDGSYVKVDSSTSGMETTTFRSVYNKDGDLISRDQEAVSTYKAWPGETPAPTANTNNNTTPARPAATARPVTPAATPRPVATPTPATPAPVNTPAPVYTPTPVDEVFTPTPVDDSAD